MLKTAEVLSLHSGCPLPQAYVPTPGLLGLPPVMGFPDLTIASLSERCSAGPVCESREVHHAWRHSLIVAWWQAGGCPSKNAAGNARPSFSDFRAKAFELPRPSSCGGLGGLTSTGMAFIPCFFILKWRNAESSSKRHSDRTWRLFAGCLKEYPTRWSSAVWWYTFSSAAWRVEKSNIACLVGFVGEQLPSRWAGTPDHYVFLLQLELCLLCSFLEKEWSMSNGAHEMTWVQPFDKSHI